MSDSLFAVDDLCGFLEGRSGLRRILHRVSLRVNPGHAVSLVGASGSGKTFLVRSVLGLHQGTPGVISGRARVLGIDVFAGLDALVEHHARDGTAHIIKDTREWGRQVAQRLRPVVGSGVTLVAQDPISALPPFHQVGKLLSLALARRTDGRQAAAPEEEARRWLQRVHMHGVDEVLHSYPHQLSGGMVQRVALALALAPAPKLLIADEPTTGLDPTLRVHILELLDEVAGAYGVTLFLITHDTEAARLLTREVAVLCGGRIVEHGPVTSVLNPQHPLKHPFTRSLLEAERRLAGADQGTLPRASHACAAETGCGFRGSCPRAEERCARRAPTLTPVDEEGPTAHHHIACWRQDVGEWLQ